MFIPIYLFTLFQEKLEINFKLSIGISKIALKVIIAVHNPRLFCVLEIMLYIWHSCVHFSPFVLVFWTANSCWWANRFLRLLLTHNLFKKNSYLRKRNYVKKNTFENCNKQACHTYCVRTKVLADLTDKIGSLTGSLHSNRNILFL